MTITGDVPVGPDEVVAGVPFGSAVPSVFQQNLTDRVAAQPVLL